MNAGDLRERVTFQKLSPTETWADIAAPATVWAAVESQGEETYRIRVRYRSDFRGMFDAAPKVRVLWGTRTLLVTDVVEAVRLNEVHVIAQHVLVDSPNLAAGVTRRQPWPE